MENSHEPIIDKDTFARVQAELARRAAFHHPSRETPETYPFTGKIVCGQCGKSYRRRINNAGTPYAKAVWICSTFNKLGKAACPSQQVPEDVLMELAGADFEKIIVPGPYRLIIVGHDGRSTEKSWEHQSRRESWTEAMKRAASDHQRDFHIRRKADASDKDN